MDVMLNRRWYHNRRRMPTATHDERLASLREVYGNDLDGVVRGSVRLDGLRMRTKISPPGITTLHEVDYVESSGGVIGALRFFLSRNWLTDWFRHDVYGSAIFRALGEECEGSVVDLRTMEFAIRSRVWTLTFGEEGTRLECRGAPDQGWATTAVADAAYGRWYPIQALAGSGHAVARVCPRIGLWMIEPGIELLDGEHGAADTGNVFQILLLSAMLACFNYPDSGPPG